MIRSKRIRKRANNAGIHYEACEPRTMLATISAGNLNSGVAVAEDATGFGYILYSQENVHSRFGDIPAANADHFIAARLDGVQWQYNNDSQWNDFEFLATDVGIAEVNFDGDAVSRSLGPVAADNDLIVVANQFGGQFDENEFQLLGTQFQSFDLPDGQTAFEFFQNRKIAQIWNSVLGYESSVGHFPTLANFDDGGAPLLSWRVHILPQLGHENLYEQFRLDQPWDSPHNLPLADQMPAVFRSPHFESGNRTTYLAVAGEDTIFPLDNTPQGFGSEPSLALVEVDAQQSVVWTEPVDWYFNESDPLAGLGNASADGFTAVDTNSRQYQLTDQIDPVAFANFATINDGQPIDNVTFIPTANILGRPALRDLGLALINFESSFMEFPNQSIKADDGTPLLSWRVAILPFLGHQNLYNQFNLDEPWDSPNNIQLLENMPNIFAHPDVEAGMTVYLGLDGDGTVFDSDPSGNINYGTIGDGTSNTITIVEADAAQAVAWSRPVDLSFDPANPSSGLGGLVGDGTFNAALADGTVLNFQPTNPARLAAWATINGGEVNDYSFTNLDEVLSTEQKFRNINRALLNFESSFQSFPRTIYSNGGAGLEAPLLSWRVAILPFIGEDNLYRQFKLDEAWDSPHNLSLLPLMPSVFASQGIEIGKTAFQGAHGDNTVFSNTNRRRGLGNFGNDLNVATIVEVNADQAIQWTKPGDFDFDADNLSAVLGNALTSGFHVGLIDGSVEFFDNTISNDVLKKLLSPRDFSDLTADFKVLRGNDSSIRFQRFEVHNQLRQLALAAINFESANRRFPQHAIYSQPRDGRPLLSWRVEILPLLGEQDLYNKFNLDEPWDSPNNLALLPLMPSYFKTASVENGKTVFQAVTAPIDPTTGQRTIFPLNNSFQTDFGDITDGSSNTVLFVQADDDRAVQWTKPEDLIYDPADPTAGIGTGTAAEGTNVVTADGAAHFIPGNLKTEFWRNLILANDGEFADFTSPSSFTSGTIVPRGATVLEDDDTFIVTVSGEVAEISVNGSVRTQNVNEIGGLFFNGLDGTDALELDAGGLPVTIIDGVFQIGDLFTIGIDSVESIELGDSLVAFQGTDGDDVWDVDVAGETTSVTVAGLDAPVVFHSAVELNFDGIAGTNQINFTTDADTFVGYESLTSGDQGASWSNVNQIDIQGQLQDDARIRFFDSVRDDVFSFRGTGATMTSAGQPEITAGGFSTILVEATEGNDVARLSGTAEGEDNFFGALSASRLETPDVNVAVFGFDLVAATSSGGLDRATLTGTDLSENFFASPQTARLVSPAFVLNATGFQTVIGNSGGGDDSATLRDSAGDDLFIDQPGIGRMEYGDAGSVNALNYSVVRAVSSAGSDEARLIGTEGADRLVASGNLFANITSDDFQAVAVGFSLVRSNGKGGQDRAFLAGTGGDDFFLGSPTTSFLNGDGFQNTVSNFETVVALDTAGRDTSLLVDSQGDDTYYANPTVAAFNGDGFSRLALGFDFVRAISSGGNDTATLRDSVGDDTFFASPELAYLRNDTFHNEARGFSSVRAVATGGNDFARLVDSAGDDMLRAFESNSVLSGSGYRNTAAGFDSVIIDASTGNDVAELFDSKTDDTFFGRADSASLQGDSYFILANNFDTFDVSGFNGGVNRFFVAETNFRWNRFGDWRRL